MCARPGPPRRAACGFTLIDVLVVMVLLGLAAGAVATLFARLANQSAALMLQQQAQAVASALLAEARSMPFTYCDPQDARVALATRASVGGSGCTALVDGLGPEPGESRYAANPALRFDGVSDYAGFTMPGPGCAGLCDASGTRLDGPGSALQGCTASVAVLAQAVAGVAGVPAIAALDADGRPQALRIAVTLRCPALPAPLLLEALRLRHAPNQG